MFADTIFRRIVFNLALLFVFLSIYVLLFYPVYNAEHIMINFALTPFDICEKYPEVWENLKLLFIPISSISSLITINLIYSTFFSKKKKITHSKPTKNTRLITIDIQWQIWHSNYFARIQSLSKHINNRNNRLWENQFSNVSIY